MGFFVWFENSKRIGGPRRSVRANKRITPPPYAALRRLRRHSVPIYLYLHDMFSIYSPHVYVHFVLFLRRRCECGPGNVFECNNIFTYPPDRSGLAYGSRKFIFKTWDFFTRTMKMLRKLLQHKVSSDRKNINTKNVIVNTKY
jgi:hypothetical protein